MKPVEDRGHLVEATKPFKLRVYEAGKLPCPVQCAGCLVIGVNRRDHNRLSLHVSDGSSWHAVSLGASPQAVVPVERDLRPMIRAAVEGMLPTLVAQPAVKVIQGPGPQSENPDVPALARGVLEMAEHAMRLENDYADLLARVEFLEKHAIAKVQAA